MAKNKSKRGRVTAANANRRLQLSSQPRLPVSNLLRSIEDRRLWHPEGDDKPASSFNRSRHRLTTVDQITRRRRRSGSVKRKVTSPSGLLRNVWNMTREVIAFQNPDKVLVCVRRQTRKEVLHAKRKTGRGGLKKPRYKWFSKISCRRR